MARVRVQQQTSGIGTRTPAVGIGSVSLQGARTPMVNPLPPARVGIGSAPPIGHINPATGGFVGILPTARVTVPPSAPQQTRQQPAPQQTRQQPAPQQTRQQQLADIQKRLATVATQAQALAQARQAGMEITPQTTVQQAQQFLGGRAAAPREGDVRISPTTGAREILTPGGVWEAVGPDTERLRMGVPLSGVSPLPTREQQAADLTARITEMQGIVDRARAAGIGPAEQIPQHIISPPAAPVPLFEQPHEDRMRALLGQYERLLTAPPPSPTGLLPEEKQLFTEEQRHLRERYDAALEGLRRKQTEEKQRLIGRYAAMGFTEPGAIAGPIAGEPGVVTEAVLRKREGQRRELADLEQARAGDILAITRAEQEAGRRARAEELGAFERRQEAARRNLENLLQLAQPERFTAGGRIFERDLITGEARDVTPPEALQQQVEIERGGRRVRVTLNAEGREIGSVDLGPVKVERAPAQPALVQEWVLAGGQAGTGMSLSDWLQLMRGRAGGAGDGSEAGVGAGAGAEAGQKRRLPGEESL